MTTLFCNIGFDTQNYKIKRGNNLLYTKFTFFIQLDKKCEFDEKYKISFESMSI